MTPTPEQAAWEILQEVEDTDFLKSMAEDRAACGNFLPTATPASFLFWFEDEAEIQEAQAETYPDEAEKRRQYATVLREVAGRLRDLGYEPSCPEVEKLVVPSPYLPPIEQAVLPILRLKQAAFDLTPAGG